MEEKKLSQKILNIILGLLNLAEKKLILSVTISKMTSLTKGVTQKVVEKFERFFAKKLGMKFALSINSGTSALLSAYYALGLKEGDEVVLPSLTFHATGTPLIKFTKNLNFVGVMR